MIPTKIDPIIITTIREEGVDSIVDWFDQHKQSFYTLGWCYLKSKQQIEELFYRSIIKVHNEVPRFKNETSFETWVTAIFIHICRELSKDNSLHASDEGESRQDLFKVLDQLNEVEKEAIALTYIKGISHEETANLLLVTVEMMKEHLFSGIQSLRKEMGYGPNFNGCKEYHKDYIDYLERTLERSKKIDLEKHIFHCPDCQEGLAAFQEVMLSMSNLPEKMEDFHVPADFMENVKARLAEMEKLRQLKIKKRKRIGIVMASVFALLIGIEVFTGSFSNLYYTWTEDNQELRAFLQQGLGKTLNLEAESDGVKIKIKSAIADDVQTLVFYEIEDIGEDNKYMIGYYDGISVENSHEIMSTDMFQRYYPPDLKSDVNNKVKNVYQGKMSLSPLKTDNGTIKLKITKLFKLIRDPSDENILNPYRNMEVKGGEWSFEIPVTKQPSLEYALDGETEVEGIPIRFDKLTIAPTATILQYAINNEQPGKRIEDLRVDHLEVNNKKMKTDIFSNSYTDQDMNWAVFQTQFDPLFGEKPKEVNVQFKSVYLTIEDTFIIELDGNREYPQSFEYAGTTISIDKVESGRPAIVVISNHEIVNRAYESLQFQIVTENENEFISMGIDSEGVLVDKNGTEYDMNKIPFPYEVIEQPRYFDTVQRVELQSDNAGENVIPKRLEIYGYNTTKYLDDVVKISLK